MTDEEVVRLVQKGETELYGKIIDTYQKKLYFYLKGLTNQDEATVDDLVEDTLVKAYENLQGFDCKKKFSSWIYRIGHNQAVDYFKKHKEGRLSEWHEETIPDSGKLAEEIEIEIEARAKVLEAVEQLIPKYREVIWLYYYENKSYDEIADILKTTTSNVGVMMKRGKDRLKKDLSLSDLRSQEQYEK